MNERRLHGRRRTFKGGKLIFNKGLSVLDCIIRDLSDDGARLELTTTASIPDQFEIIIAPDQIKRFCKTVWRTPSQVGVLFLTLERAKPNQTRHLLRPMDKHSYED